MKKRHKVWKSETLKMKRTRMVDTSETRRKSQWKKPKVEREELEEREFVETQFRFFKVEKKRL